MCGWRVCLDAAAQGPIRRLAASAFVQKRWLCWPVERLGLGCLFSERGSLPQATEAVFRNTVWKRVPKVRSHFGSSAPRLRGALMQTLARQAIAELAKGVSTGLVVWAGTAPCTPTLVCSSCALCPDCHCSCHDGVRAPRLADADCGGFSLGWLVAALACGVALGLALASGLRRRGEPEAAPRRSPCASLKAGKGVVRQLD